MYSISKKYNTTVNELKKLNNLTTDTLSIGQVLQLPTVSRNTYTVQKGDTLYRIASANNTTVQAIKELNNLITDTLSIGQILQIPSTEVIKIPTTTTNYSVKNGDTLYSIAKKYNTTVEQIKILNNLTTNLLSIGQVLKIPTTEYLEVPTNTITYTVKPGDTLYSIAREYNTTPNNIKQLNNLSTNIITIGQKILLEN